jgi:hypothetical protein
MTGVAVLGYIPKGARWYIAGLVLEHIIEGDPRNVVQVNTHLIEADAPDMAYRKANDLGKASEMEFANTDGKRVRVIFRGLRDLDVIHDDLEDGAELFYEEKVGIPDDDLRQWVKPKDELNVFAPKSDKSGGPNYLPETVAKMMEPEG